MALAASWSPSRGRNGQMAGGTASTAEAGGTASTAIAGSTASARGSRHTFGQAAQPVHLDSLVELKEGFI